jgi:NADH dehydrogenase/NADH:ubiquinone oxidoreductase subunit G
LREGRFGFDYVANPQRLLKPMIRKDGVPKVPHEMIDPSNPWTHFREATWEEALDRAAGGLKKIRDRDGPDALAGFGSAKGSNEEAYLFQKLVRTGFGTNNVDHCTRLCHASSVSALLEGVGSAAVTATFNECKNSEVIIVIGANPTDNHPVAATFFKQAAKRGAKLVVMDPRGTGDEAPRLEDDAVQERHRRGDAQRHAQRHRHREALRPAVHPDLRRGLRGRGRRTSRTSRRRRWRRSAASMPTPCARSRAPTPAPKARSSSGAWASRSTPTAPTTRAA